MYKTWRIFWRCWLKEDGLNISKFVSNVKFNLSESTFCCGMTEYKE